MRFTRQVLLLLIAGLIPACGPGDGKGPPVDQPVDRGVGNADRPTLCSEGSQIYAVWRDFRSGTYEIYFNRSLDDARTWSTLDLRLDHGPSGAGNLALPQICSSGTNVYVVWEDSRNGATDLYFNRSLDSGATWLATDVRIDHGTPGAAASSAPRICCSGMSVYVAWNDDRNGMGDIYFNRSLDGGTTWDPADTRLDTDTAGAAASDSVCLACNGSMVVVVWRETRNGSDDVYSNASGTSGASWSSDRQVDTAAAGVQSRNPRVSFLPQGSNVYVVWEDTRAGGSAIYMNRSLLNGTSWMATDQRLDFSGSPGAAMKPAITSSGNVVHVVWEDTRGWSPRQIWHNVSTTYGMTWLSSDLSLSPYAYDARTPSITTDGSRVAVAWHESPFVGPPPEHHLQSITLPIAGSSWGNKLFELSGGVYPANKDPAQLACSPSSIVAIWSEFRSGAWHVFSNRRTR